jgi:hypothetical protein
MTWFRVHGVAMVSRGSPSETNRADGYCCLAGVRWIDETTSW